MLNIMPITTAVIPQFIYIYIYKFISFDAYLRYVLYYAILQCSYNAHIMLMRKLVPHLYQVGMVAMSQK